MEGKYTYKGMDLTLDIYESIRDAVEAIAEDEGTDFAKAYALFARSKTYEALANPKSLMWSESIPFIMDEYRAETGDA